MSTQQSFTYDITQNRHKGNRQSVKANPSDQVKTEQQIAILEFIEARTTWGATSAEIETATGWAKNRFSGRLSELRYDLKEIVTNGRRSGCTVYVSKKYAPEVK